MLKNTYPTIAKKLVNLDASYNQQGKATFQSNARLLMREIVREFEIGAHDLRTNKGGIAVSGEVTLHTDTIYIQASQKLFQKGIHLLVRQCEGRKDYCGKANHYHEFNQGSDHLEKLISDLI